MDKFANWPFGTGPRIEIENLIRKGIEHPDVRSAYVDEVSAHVLGALEEGETEWAAHYLGEARQVLDYEEFMNLFFLDGLMLYIQPVKRRAVYLDPERRYGGFLSVTDYFQRRFIAGPVADLARELLVTSALDEAEQCFDLLSAVEPLAKETDQADREKALSVLAAGLLDGAMMAQTSRTHWEKLATLAHRVIAESSEEPFAKLDLAAIAVAGAMMGKISGQKLSDYAWSRNQDKDSNPQAVLTLRLGHMLVERAKLSPMSWQALSDSLGLEGEWPEWLWELLALVVQDLCIREREGGLATEERGLVQKGLEALSAHATDKGVRHRPIHDLRISYLSYISSPDWSREQRRKQLDPAALVLVAELGLNDRSLFAYRAAVEGKHGDLAAFKLYKEIPELLPPEVFESHPLLEKRKARQGGFWGWGRKGQ